MLFIILFPALLNYCMCCNYFDYPSLKLIPSYEVLELAPRIFIGPFLNEDNIDLEAFYWPFEVP